MSQKQEVSVILLISGLIDNSIVILHSHVVNYKADCMLMYFFLKGQIWVEVLQQKLKKLLMISN